MSTIPSVGIFLDPFHDADVHSRSRAPRLCALHALVPVPRHVDAAAAAALPGCPKLPGPVITASASNLLRQRGDQVEGGSCQRSVQPLVADDSLGNSCKGVCCSHPLDIAQGGCITARPYTIRQMHGTAHRDSCVTEDIALFRHRNSGVSRSLVQHINV